MTILSVALVILAIMTLGATVQSLSGMGFGMVAVPVIALVVGPAEGVLWGNLGGTALAAVLTWAQRGDIDWRRAGIMTAAAIPAVAASVWLLQGLSNGVMDLLIGLFMLGMVAFSLAAPRLPEVGGVGPAILAGATGACLSATVAQSGPAMAAYAQATRWEQRQFAATIQPYFLALNLMIVPAKFATHVGTAGILAHPWLVGIVILAVSGGAVLGRWAQRLVSPRLARSFAIMIAAIGAILISYRGFVEVF